jgi:diacylglycerol kinase
MTAAFMKRWPRAFCYAIAGMIVGASTGYSIGGIGVAMRGGAFRFPTEVLLAIAVALVGCWVGVKRDRMANQTKEAAN